MYFCWIKLKITVADNKYVTHLIKYEKLTNQSEVLSFGNCKIMEIKAQPVKGKNKISCKGILKDFFESKMRNPTNAKRKIRKSYK